jgi:glucose/arabinose dehydrogenase
LTCDASGNLYVGYNSVNGEVAKITPGQVVSVYATGLNSPGGLAFDASGDLFITSNGTITEIPPGGGTGTVFAPGLGNVTGLAIMPVPEPSTWALAALGGVVFLLRRKKQGCFKPNPCGRS